MPPLSFDSAVAQRMPSDGIPMTDRKAREKPMSSLRVDSRRWFERLCVKAMTVVPCSTIAACFVIASVALASLCPSVSADETAWQDIAGELMSPACPGRTLLNCTSEHAGQWQELIRQKVAQGESRDEIVQFFVDMSGEEVLASPPKRGFSLAVWLLPAFAIVNGAGLVVLLTTRWARHVRSHQLPVTVSAGPHPGQDSSASADPYLSRVRRDLQDI